jgi:hypothetical protein
MGGSDTADQSIVSVLVATDLPAADLSLSGVSQARVDEIQAELKTLIIRAKEIPSRQDLRARRDDPVQQPGRATRQEPRSGR